MIEERDILNIIVIFIMAFLPSIIYIKWIRNVEYYQREPWKKIAKTFIYGATAAVFIAVLLYAIMISILEMSFGREYEIEKNTLDFLILAIIIAPFLEEYAKARGVKYAGEDLDEVEDGLIYGASCGLGFASTENLLYEAIAYYEGGLVLLFATFFLRTISSALLHASATSLTGYGIARSVVEGRSKLIIVPYYLGAVLMHSFFNLLASIGKWYSLIFAVFFAILAVEFMRHKVHQLDFKLPTKVRLDFDRREK